MSVYNPRQRTQIYAEISAQILANAPITSTELGTTSDNIAFAFSDQLYELYVQVTNSLSLLNLNNITGSDLDTYGNQFPDLQPRFQSTTATTGVTVTDPTVGAVISTLLAFGGASAGAMTINVASTVGFPSTGYVLVGTAGNANYEKFQYTSTTGTSFVGPTGLTFSHASFETVTLSTGGDRVFSGPYIVKTQASSISSSNQYQSINTPAFTILDGQSTAIMAVQCTQSGSAGNTSPGTITLWSGSPPLGLDGHTPLTVDNLSAVTNGTDQENDPSFRARIREEIQALSSGNIDAVVSVAESATLNGTVVKFIQVVEAVAPFLPAKVYIDDGSGTVYLTPTTIAYAIPLVSSSLGGEFQFYIPSQYIPIVYTPAEALAYVFGNIALYLNAIVANGNVTISSVDVTGMSSIDGITGGMTVVGPGIQPGTTVVSASGTTVVLSLAATASSTGAAALMFGGTLLVQGTGASQYLVQPDRGIIQLGTPMETGQSLVIGTIGFYGALIQQVNYEIYGIRAMRNVYPGISALGSWIEVLGAQVLPQFVTAIITPDGSQTLAAIATAITQNIMNYVNSLGIASTVSYNKIISLCFVSGVKDASVTLNGTTGDAIISDGQIPTITFPAITINGVIPA